MKASDKDLLMKAGIAIGAYIFIVKPILEKVGLQKTAEQIATEQQNKDRINTWVDNTTAVQKPTKTEAEWKIIADQIYADLRYSSIDDNKNDAAYQVCRVKNDADVAMLFKMFAKRQEYHFGIPDGGLKNLTQFIVSNLSRAKIAEINGNYSRKNIKFRF